MYEEDNCVILVIWTMNLMQNKYYDVPETNVGTWSAVW